MEKIDWNNYLNRDIVCSLVKHIFVILKKLLLKKIMPFSSFQEFLQNILIRNSVWFVMKILQEAAGFQVYEELTKAGYTYKKYCIPL